MKEYILDGSRFSTLAEAATEFTRALDLPEPWTGNLDAFDDLLCGRTANSGDKTVIIWRNSESSRKQLHYEETVRWYEKHLLACDTSTLSSFDERLAAAQQQEGPTVFDWLVEIIRDHEQIDLRLE